MGVNVIIVLVLAVVGITFIAVVIEIVYKSDKPIDYPLSPIPKEKGEK